MYKGNKSHAGVVLQKEPSFNICRLDPNGFRGGLWLRVEECRKDALHLVNVVLGLELEETPGGDFLLLLISNLNLSANSKVLGYFVDLSELLTKRVRRLKTVGGPPLGRARTEGGRQ